MDFEDEIGRLNEHFFYKEFIFSKNTFRPHPDRELELADNILWLDDLLVVFQLKERGVSTDSTEERESKWFRRKVINKGTRQIRDTLDYMKKYKNIELENHRGHKFTLDESRITMRHNVVSFSAHTKLPVECRLKKRHRSRTAGVIHLIPANDYWGIVQTLLTPMELCEYLNFREKLVEKWEKEIEPLPEHAILGQYLSGDNNSIPCLAFTQYLVALDHRIDEWDISGIIKNFPDRVTSQNEPTDYYNIILELAKLKRMELREFKTRYKMSIDKCRANEITHPYRIACPRTNCGFVFIPLNKEFLNNRRKGLKNLTLACKYDLKLSKCIGASFAPDNDGWYSVEWCYMEFPWEFNLDLDKMLTINNPFREVNTTEIPKYTFKKE